MSISPKTLDTIADLVRAKAEAQAFSGVVQLQHENITLWQEAFGYANRAWNIPNTSQTRFRMASIGKMFTAVAILQLIDEGRLSLETRLLDCLPLAETTIPPETTIFHLLTMTSGVADWFEETDEWEAQWAELCRTTPLYLLRQNRDYLPLFSQKPPAGPLGVYRYSNASYILLGLVLEQITGLTYAEVIRQRVFAAANMTDSGFWGLDEVIEGVAEGYIPQRDASDTIIGWQRNVYEATPDAAADGGVVSTVSDLVWFIKALQQGQLLSPSLTQAMLTPQVLTDTERFRGYGWYYGYGNAFLLNDQHQIVRYGHTGEEAGVSCRLYHYPTLSLDVIILGNQSDCAGSVGWVIHDVLVNEAEDSF